MESAPDIENKIIFAKLAGAERVERARTRSETISLLAGTSKARIDRKAGDDLRAMEDAAGGSLKLAMIERVKALFAMNSEPVRKEDIHAWVTHDLQPYVVNKVVRAYLTNSVAWGLADCVRKGLLIRLDKNQEPVMLKEGRKTLPPAEFYQAA